MRKNIFTNNYIKKLFYSVVYVQAIPYSRNFAIFWGPFFDCLTGEKIGPKKMFLLDLLRAGNTKANDK